MSALPKLKLTALEYLAIERGAEFRASFSGVKCSPWPG